MKFIVPYYVKSGGDGSANVEFCPDAEQKDEDQQENGEGWGEPSFDTLQLKIDGNRILYRTYGDDGWMWVEAEKAKD